MITIISYYFQKVKQISNRETAEYFYFLKVEKKWSNFLCFSTYLISFPPLSIYLSIYLSSYIYIYTYLLNITIMIIFHQCHLFTRSGKTLMNYFTSRNCKVSLFSRCGKNEVNFCIYLYIWFYFHKVQNIIHLLIAQSTNIYLIFLTALYFTNVFY